MHPVDILSQLDADVMSCACLGCSGRLEFVSLLKFGFVEYYKDEVSYLSQLFGPTQLFHHKSSFHRCQQELQP